VSHDPDVATVSLRLDRVAPLEGFRRWLDTLLWEKVDVMDIFRIKGVLLVSGSKSKHVVQVRWELRQLASGVAPGVLLGAESALQACFVCWKS
jgi:Cobalamin synthesis protein cobW C-terminal domain